MIKYLVMDVDGTLTDGKIYIGNSGEVFKAFSARDGYGIHELLIPAGIIPVIITGRTSEIVKNRARELEIKHVYQGRRDKIGTLRGITENLGEVAYIGDDGNDMNVIVPVKEAGGLIGCPQNAAKMVLDIADFIAPHVGGDGAVRDFIDWILENNK